MTHMNRLLAVVLLGLAIQASPATAAKPIDLSLLVFRSETPADGGGVSDEAVRPSLPSLRIGSWAGGGRCGGRLWQLCGAPLRYRRR